MKRWVADRMEPAGMRTSQRLSACAAVLVLLSGCGGAPSEKLDHLVIATGEKGDIYDRLGHALADASSADAEVVNTAGSVENLRLVAAGKADVAFATVDTVQVAMDGDPPFDNALQVVTLARLYDDYLQIVVAADNRIEQVSDLVDLPVSIGLKDSGTEVVAARAMEAAGHDIGSVRQRQLSPSRSADALRSGEIMAFFVTGGLPTPAVATLAAQKQIRVLPITDEMDELQEREYYLPRSITPGTYPGQEDEVPTIGIPNVLVVRRDMPDGVAYRLTELLFSAKRKLVEAHGEARRLDRRAALATFPVPLHPGAQKYYRDSKVMALRPL
jgi:uncharacterized protein